ncbi:MAG: hypothetical protein ACQ5SW_07575 [Sphaerochaetaceae bacterium]
MEHETTQVVDLVTLEAREHLMLSFDLLGGEGMIQVRVVSPNGVSSWIESVQATVSPAGVSHYRVGPLSMGTGIPLPSGDWEVTIINDDGIARTEQIAVTRSGMTNLPEILPHYESEHNSIISLPLPCMLHRYDETGGYISTITLKDSTYTLSQEDAYLAIEANGVTYLFQHQVR